MTAYHSKIVAFILTISLVSCGAENDLSLLLSDEQAKIDIDNLLAQSAQLDSRAERIKFLSAAFLGAPYAESPLGEGKEDAYDNDPLYRFDSFDCTTYVETIGALAVARDFNHFELEINKIRYRDGLVSFVTRNHFTSLDWIPNNSARGFVTDVTKSVGPTETATTTIKKRAWYEKLHRSELENFLATGVHTEPVEASIPYIHLDSIFVPQPVPEDVQHRYLSEIADLEKQLNDLPENAQEVREAMQKKINDRKLAHRVAYSRVNEDVLNKIPDGAIINVVRPDWNLERYIGTNLNISHQGIAVWKGGRLYYRNASSREKKVADYPFIETFQSYLMSPTIKGFDVLVIE